jgi:type IV secretion system protein TrbG
MYRFARFGCVAYLSLCLSLAQNSEPVHVTRTVPKASPAKRQDAKSKTTPIVDPNSAAFKKAADLLNQDISKRPLIQGSITEGVIGDHLLVLPESAIEAIRLQSAWQRNDDNRPMGGPDGKVIYTYGKGLPNIPVAIFHVTTIELRKGETFDAAVPYIIGDEQLWKVDTHTIYADGRPQAFISVSPKNAGSDTNLTVFTNQRPYDIRLLSTMDGYVSRVAFRYPADEERENIQAAEAYKAAAAQRSRHEEELKAADTIREMHSNSYEIKHGKDAPHWMVPLRVWNDGSHMRIEFSEDARNRNLPILVIEGKEGKDAPNVHPDMANLTYTVDALPEKCKLISGTGWRHKQTVEIVETNGRR